MISDLILWRGETKDAARGRCRILITDWREGSGKVAMAGNYDLTFARLSDGWFIAQLEAAFLQCTEEGLQLKHVAP